MKKIIALSFFIVSINLFAQDWAKVNPEMNNIVVDTTLIRSTIAVIEPGKKSDFHTHPAHFFYALTEGKIKIYYMDGTSQVLELKAGDAGFSNPEKQHQTENVGDKTIKFLLVELKEHPYTASDSK